MKDSSSSEDSSESIKIYCRLRPVTSRKAIMRVDENFEESRIFFNRPKRAEQGLINNTRENFAFTFNGLFNTESSQEDVFERCAKNCVLR